MKFHFVVPDLHVVVEAESIEEAKAALVEATCTAEIDGEWDLLGFDGEPEQIRACIVCGCTDEMACDGGCSRAVFGDDGPVCSFDDEAHARLRGEIEASWKVRSDDGVFV